MPDVSQGIRTGLPTSEAEYTQRRESLRTSDAERRVGADAGLIGKFSRAEKAANRRLLALRDGLLKGYSSPRPSRVRLELRR